VSATVQPVRYTHAGRRGKGRLVLVQTQGHGHRILIATVPPRQRYYERASEKGIKTQDIRTQNSLPSLMLQVVCSFVIMIIMNRACLWHQGEEERTTSVTDYRPIYVLLLILVVVSYQPYTGFCT
jgi:hypothetical protein